MLAGELTQRNELTISLEEARQAWSVALTQTLFEAGFRLDQDFLAFTAFLTGGIHYLAIRSRNIKDFGDANIGDDQTWAHLSQLIENATRGFFPDDGRNVNSGDDSTEDPGA